MKAELIGFANALDVECKRKTKGDSRIPGLSNWKDRVLFAKMEKTWRGKYSWERDQELIRKILNLMSGRQLDTWSSGDSLGWEYKVVSH